MPRALGDNLEYFGGHDGTYYPPPPPPPILPRLWPSATDTIKAAASPNTPTTGSAGTAATAAAAAEHLSLEERVARIKARLKSMGKDEL